MLWMRRSYPNKLPAFQLCSWVGSGTVDLELACLRKLPLKWSIRRIIRQFNSLFIMQWSSRKNQSHWLNHNRCIFPKFVTKKNPSQSSIQSLPPKKKSPKCSPNFSPSFSFGWSERRRKPARLPWTRDPSVATRIPPRSAMPLGLRQHPAMRHRHVRHKIPGHPLGSSMLQRAHETLASTAFQKISEEFITKHVFHDSFQ